MTNTHVTKFMTGTALALALAAAPALAQTSAPVTQAPAAGQAQVPPAATDTIGRTTADAALGLPTQPILSQLEPGQITSSEVIGMEVRNSADESVGSIDDLVIDEQNRVIAGVVSVGGFLGIGAKNVAVNWREFSFDPDERIASVTLTREALEDAPAFRDREELHAKREADTPTAAPMTTDRPAGATPPTTPPVTSE
jgi:hypothetical protein